MCRSQVEIKVISDTRRIKDIFRANREVVIPVILDFLTISDDSLFV